MTEWWLWSALFAAGLGLGLFFYGGLWWTVRKMPRARHPVGMMLASFVVRLGVTTAGFALLTAGDWRRMLAALLGFVLMRGMLVNRFKSADAVQSG